MGTDIHVVVEVRVPTRMDVQARKAEREGLTTRRWVAMETSSRDSAHGTIHTLLDPYSGHPVADLVDDRDYDLFGDLARVRRCRGSSVPSTYGVPPDASPEAEKFNSSFYHTRTTIVPRDCLSYVPPPLEDGEPHPYLWPAWLEMCRQLDAHFGLEARIIIAFDC